MKIDPIAAIIGVVGTIITAFVIHLLIGVRDKKNSFVIISEDLRKPFIEARSILDLNTRGLDQRCDPKDVFVQLYSDQRRNILAILPHVPAWQRKRMQVAWDKYEQEIRTESPCSWFSSDGLYKETEDIKDKRTNCIKNLDRILFFFNYHNMFSITKLVQRWTS